MLHLKLEWRDWLVNDLICRCSWHPVCSVAVKLHNLKHYNWWYLLLGCCIRLHPPCPNFISWSKIYKLHLWIVSKVLANWLKEFISSLYVHYSPLHEGKQPVALTLFPPTLSRSDQFSFLHFKTLIISPFHYLKLQILIIELHAIL